MRKMYITVSLLMLSLCLVVEASYYLTEYFPAIEGGINKEGRKLGLRKTADQSLPMIEWLPDGAFAPVQFEGERWIYIVYKNQKYAIPKKLFSLGYSNLCGLITVPTHKYHRYQGWISQHIRWFHFCLTFSILLLLVVRWKIKSIAVKKTFKNKPITRHHSFIDSRHTDKTIFVNSPVELQTGYQNDDLKKRLISELYTSKIFLEALNIVFKGKIEEMETAVQKMREEFNHAKKAAGVLGVDLDSSNLPALVKGRQFEIFAAKRWDADCRTTIQSWTPDKGINEGIYIKSNGEPDFLLELQMPTEPQLMSIECKYRSIYTAQDKSEKRIQWIKYYQYKRYEEYQECTGRNVYMLLGVDGDPRSPDYLYFAPISKLKEKSLFDDREDFKNYYAFPESLEPFRVTDLTMMDSIFSCYPQ